MLGLKFKLEVGDEILTSDGKFKEVKKVEFTKFDEPVKIYNLNIDGFHTYYVGEDGLLVHNDCTALEMAAGREYAAGMRNKGKTNAKEIAHEATKFVTRIKLAIQDLKKAIDLYKKYPKNSKKTVAVSGNTNTISGWSDNAIEGIEDFNRTKTYLDIFDKADDIIPDIDRD